MCIFLLLFLVVIILKLFTEYVFEFWRNRGENQRTDGWISEKNKEPKKSGVNCRYESNGILLI